ncbi:hypothetical protein [Streptomyces marincola]|uniref:hypothetical protein n=1 Tax=Streptomyces marincola TaxID=2878388 RepID=UPI00131D2665|nr:hypothetical protein [Streptomyces marincola]
MAATVAAGTVPDVIKGWGGDNRVFLTVLCAVSALLFAGINWLQQRRRGVGIVVTLRRSGWREPWTHQWAVAANDHARRHHDSCFVVQREIRAAASGQADPDSDWARARRNEIDVAWELVNARLMEAAMSDPAAPVSLYVNAALPEAYELGAKLKFNVQRTMRALVTPALQQRAELSGSDFHPALSVSARLKEPLTASEATKAARLVQTREKVFDDNGSAGADDAVALVVHLAHNPAMVAEALNASRAGCVDVTGARARCRVALVIDACQANLPENNEDFELVVRHVYAAWGAWLRENPEYAALRKRLFIAAPVTIGLALGWLLGHTVSPVPHPYIGVGDGNR